MSVKNYHGLIATAEDPFAVSGAIRSVLEPLFLEDFKKFHAEAKAAYSFARREEWEEFFQLDELRLNLPEGKSFAGKAVHALISALHSSKTWTFSAYDIGYDVQLIANGAGTEPLVLVFGEKSPSYREALIMAGVVNEYGYWTNSEKPDEVTAAEWAGREKAWAAISKKAPAEVGLGFTFPSAIASELSLIKK